MMPVRTRDLRVESIRPLLPPAILIEELPLGERAAQTVSRAREAIGRILNREDDRILVVVGPCSIHDPKAAREYARRLKQLADSLAADLHIVMRVYFEKPRTTVGWKGLINDPHLNGSYAINEGVRIGRRLLLDLLELGVPAGCEFLDPISPQFTSDLVSWVRSAPARPRARRIASWPPGSRGPWDSRTEPTAACRLPSTRCARSLTRTASWASPSRGWPASSSLAAIPTATSSCAAARAGPTTTPSASRKRWPRYATPVCPSA